MGALNTTPVEAGGCVVAETSTGNEYALDATTGAVVWRTTLNVPHPSDSGGALVGAPVIDGTMVIQLVDEAAQGGDGPYVVALDRSTGHIDWQSAPLTTYPGSYTNASAVVSNGIVFAGYSPPEGDPKASGGFVLLDEATGHTLVTTPTIPPADQALGYAGGGIWSTAAVDPATRYAYVGTGNPYSKTIEHPHTNAIIKVDLDRGRPTFGQIVASYKGNVDQYLMTLQALSKTPACAATSNDVAISFACGQLDLDFGASANLFHDTNGNLLVGDLQKSGVYHVANTVGMTPQWTALLGVPCALCNLASTAADPTSVYGAASAGGVLQALDETTGKPRWLTLLMDGVHYESVSEANGVVYTVDTLGLFDAFSATTGLPLLRRPMALDTGKPLMYSLASSGVSVADHMVFAGANSGIAQTAESLGLTGLPSSITSQEAGAFVIAYRPKPLLPGL